ncbi:hypothetical protein DWW29_05585 [Bacteroides fragilis]|nr:hypothetical protein DWY70_03510 [Bacteroides fragilis]RGV01108.1 hypothetical protein DWW29_05585 [Bacteroides fragilis]RHB25684.1 hypothetical protein DW891_04235 [Bacteroides fragilis]
MDIICTFALRLKVSEYIRFTLASLHGKIRCRRCITGTRRVVQLVHDEMYNWYTTSCTTGISYPLKESKLARNITWNSLEKY